MSAPDLVVIGGPSLDRVTNRGETHSIVGGAGYLTALAARASGASVGLVSRVSRTLPSAVAEGFAPGRIDPGGLVPTDGTLPEFHIRYDESDRATYEAVTAGAESSTVASDVPRRCLDARHIHVSPLGGTVVRLLTLVEALRARGFVGTLSAGTYPRAVSDEPDTVRTLFDGIDLAFMNASEFEGLYPSGPPEPGPDLVVTNGPDDVRVWSHGAWEEYAIRPAEVVVDPTGAGDAFCGGYLAGRLGFGEPVVLARVAAARALSGLGGAGLLTALPVHAAGRVVACEPSLGVAVIAPDRIAHVASDLASQASGSALDFCGFPFPERDDPKAIEILALATLHQFGFWSADDRGYIGPMWAEADGKRFKGSDFVWQAFTRAAASDSTLLDPVRLASEPLLFDQICVANDGECPIPDSGAHRALQQGYGEALRKIDGGISTLVDQANQSDKPAATLLASLRLIPGYAEDPLAKKAILLVLILANRPEALLDLRDPESLGPIVDYHLMRGCLRTGCVTIIDPDLLARMEARAWISAGDEAAVRAACFDALGALGAASGLSVAQIDGFFFVNGRKRCLETEAPTCHVCPLESACGKVTDLFQPIFRTTAY
jgi:sugar/nucleoside kinase (ribokinase family)